MGAEITNQTRLEPQLHYSGPEFLREGFRPLFFLAGLWAALSVPLWIGIWSAAISYPGLGDGTMWHVHEMMFGYVGAALGGFVLTAVPNWTGRPPVRGWPLGALALIWLCGRIAVWWGGTVGPIPTAVADLAYLGVLSVLVGNAIVAGRNWRNLPVLAGLILMLTANVLFHLSAAGVADVGEAGVRLSIAVMSLLLALIGGRIVPSFTHDWFARRAGPNIPAPMGRFDQATLAVTSVALAAWVGSAPVLLSGIILTLAGALNLVRLARWRGWRTAAEPLVTVLHAGYFWLALGLGLLGVIDARRLGDGAAGAACTYTRRDGDDDPGRHDPCGSRPHRAQPPRWTMGCRDIRFGNAGGLHARSLRGHAGFKSALGNRRQLVCRLHAVYRLFRADVVPAAQGVKPVSLGSYAL